MYTYIKKNTKHNFITLSNELDSALYNIGTTWVDYNQNKYVKLNDEQIEFHEANPDASIKEVWLCKLNVVTEPTRTIEDAKNDMLRKIDEYDISKSVNNFIVNNINAWFTPAERNNYKQSVEAAKLMGVEMLSLYIGDTLINISTTMAEQLLAQIQLYADNCFMVTKYHKLNIETLANTEIEHDEDFANGEHENNAEYEAKVKAVIDTIDTYDYTLGYPSMLHFEL